eukprot:CAMPEP_0119562418 /NCGR_PEP_ID=MMETSP1352-20130426/20381_1 /TAXON_ID=265584 /ORGANISM="Stauroneis constricta, Strain CCMP1120" /LENGTH=789 /DNA_ID=CAMNT_0007610813 /DNA_START=77 /DNA_END=2446 /DNA_ORIENTATION=+
MNNMNMNMNMNMNNGTDAMQSIIASQQQRRNAMRNLLLAPSTTQSQLVTRSSSSSNSSNRNDNSSWRGRSGAVASRDPRSNAGDDPAPALNRSGALPQLPSQGRGSGMMVTAPPFLGLGVDPSAAAASQQLDLLDTFTASMSAPAPVTAPSRADADRSFLSSGTHSFSQQQDQWQLTQTIQKLRRLQEELEQQQLQLQRQRDHQEQINHLLNLKVQAQAEAQMQAEANARRATASLSSRRNPPPQHFAPASAHKSGNAQLSLASGSSMWEPRPLLSMQHGASSAGFGFQPSSFPAAASALADDPLRDLHGRAPSLSSMSSVPMMIPAQSPHATNFASLPPSGLSPTSPSSPSATAFAPNAEDFSLAPASFNGGSNNSNNDNDAGVVARGGKQPECSSSSKFPSLAPTTLSGLDMLASNANSDPFDQVPHCPTTTGVGMVPGGAVVDQLWLGARHNDFLFADEPGSPTEATAAPSSSKNTKDFLLTTLDDCKNTLQNMDDTILGGFGASPAPAANTMANHAVVGKKVSPSQSSTKSSQPPSSLSESKDGGSTPTATASAAPESTKTRRHNNRGSVTEVTTTPTGKVSTVSYGPTQSEQWNDKYEELVAFRRRYGHCHVPNSNLDSSRPLAHWVRRQRHQYRRKMEGKHSTLSDERQRALEELDFVWDSHAAIWEERYQELVDFQAQYGHCKVPRRYPTNTQLAIWVKCQRRQRQLNRSGERTALTPDRESRLDALGFVWYARGNRGHLVDSTGGTGASSLARRGGATAPALATSSGSNTTTSSFAMIKLV